MQIDLDIRNSVTRWSLSMLVRRFCWQYGCQPVFWLLPGPLSRLKVLLLRLWGAKIGGDVLIRQRVRVLMPWNLELGNVVAIGTAANFYNFAKITIGDQVVISQGAFLCTGSHDYEHPAMLLTYKPITVQAYAWIAADAFIAPGVAIGKGSVVGARSVVTRDTLAWTVVAGNPARSVKKRELRGSPDISRT
jgi:putative colanic acid biosynthesis acetyltransferase WcaF